MHFTGLLQGLNGSFSALGLNCLKDSGVVSTACPKILDTGEICELVHS